MQIQIGRYLVGQCCQRPDEPHSVIHGVSHESIICGVPQFIAIQIADAFSIYAPDFKDSIIYSEIPIALSRWKNSLRPEHDESYVAFHERVYKRRPVPHATQLLDAADLRKTLQELGLNPELRRPQV